MIPPAVALSGGATPRAAYGLLAAEPLRSAIAWERVHLFWGDERCVPPEHSDSDYGMAHEALIAHVPIPPENVHRLHGEDDPGEAARAYAAELRSAVPARAASRADLPVLDLVLLGLGDNGHTASLFPHSAALHETERLVVATEVDAAVRRRLTMTVPVINAAREVVFLVQGAAKADVVRRVLEGPYEPDELPAQLVAPDPGRLTWLLDEAAASALDRGR